MADPAPGGMACDEAVVFVSYLKDIADPRQQGKVKYPLPESLLRCLLAVLAGAETISDIALFDGKKLGLMPRMRPFAGFPGVGPSRSATSLRRRASARWPGFIPLDLGHRDAAPYRASIGYQHD